MAVYEKNTSKYIKPTRERNIFYGLSVVFVFCMYIMPQYFGLDLFGFDLTTLRLMMIVMLLTILDNNERKKQFGDLVFTKGYSIPIALYLLVCLYTMVFRVDIKAFLNPFLEIVAFYLTIYIFKHVFGPKKSYRILIGFVYFLTILGIIEYFMGHSPFEYLVTLSGMYTGRFVRSGQYRIMSSFNHSLGYGLMLVTVAPFACLDEEKNEINLLAHIPLLMLIALNIILTGSRSTLAVFLLEIGVSILFSKREVMKKTLFIGSFLLIGVVVLLALGRSTSIGRYALLQILSVIDQLFNTTYSVNYGGNVQLLQASSHYRDLLPKVFKVDWLNPILGIGRKRSFSAEIDGYLVRSIDNFYVAEYIRYAYPGMIAMILISLYFIGQMMKRSFREGSGIMRTLMIGSGAYLLNLVWLDDLGTRKYLYIIFALFIVFAEEKESDALSFARMKTISKKSQSKYMRY